MKRVGKGFDKLIARLKQLDTMAVEFGVLEPDASTLVSSENKPKGGKNTPITMGKLAHILEEGRTFQHQSGTTLTRNGKSFHIQAGTWIHIPARPFLRTTLLEDGGRVFWYFKDDVQKFLSGSMSAKKLLEKQGKFMVKSVRETMNSQQFEPLSDMTESLKGHDKQFVDSGRLQRAISYRIIED